MGVKASIAWLSLAVCVGQAEAQNGLPIRRGVPLAASVTSNERRSVSSFGPPEQPGAVPEAAAAEPRRETLGRLESSLAARTAHLRLLRALPETSDEQRRQENLLIDEIRVQRAALASLRLAIQNEEQP